MTGEDTPREVAMVDISAKPATARRAIAEAVVHLNGETLARVRAGTLPKGDPLEVARVAGIMAAKQMAHLLPLCHPLPLDHIAVEPRLEESAVVIVATVATRAPTGPDMEALGAAAVAALTVYDMCKGVQPDITIGPVRLLQKEGGQSGRWTRGDD